MNLNVKRHTKTEHSTIGTLTIEGRSFQCYTLEPVTRTDDVKPRAIPAGRYPLVLSWSPKHGRVIPHVENVPGFEEIEIHIGNYPKDTEGCTLVGTGWSEDMVGGSHGAFDKLFNLLSEGYELRGVDTHIEVGQITYEDL